MLIGIEGGLGEGKTIMLVRYLLKDYNKGKKILSNMGSLQGFDYSMLDIKTMLEMDNENVELHNCTIGIDEITVVVDCRTSASKKNRLFSYFVLQSRKRNVNVYYTTQDLGMLDFRLTNHTHIVVMCNNIYDKYNKIVDNWKHYTILDFTRPRKPTKNSFDLYIKPFYDFYNTDEIIKPI